MSREPVDETSQSPELSSIGELQHPEFPTLPEIKQEPVDHWGVTPPPNFPRHLPSPTRHYGFDLQQDHNGRRPSQRPQLEADHRASAQLERAVITAGQSQWDLRLPLPQPSSLARPLSPLSGYSHHGLGSRPEAQSYRHLSGRVRSGSAAEDY